METIFNFKNEIELMRKKDELSSSFKRIVVNEISDSIEENRKLNFLAAFLLSGDKEARAFAIAKQKVLFERASELYR